MSRKCVHLGNPDGAASVVYIDRKGRRREEEHPLHACEIHGECLPTCRCTERSKAALAEWIEKSGREADIVICFGCKSHAVDRLGYEPKEPNQ